MKRFLYIIVLALLASASFSSCTNKELCYDHRHGVRIRLAIRWSISVGVYINGPQYVKASFYPVNGERCIDHYITPSEPYLFLAEQTYDVVVYNYRISADAQTVQFRSTGRFADLEASTSLWSKSAQYSRTASDEVMLGPDSLWAWSTGTEHFVVSTEEFTLQQTRADSEVIEELVLQLDTEPKLLTSWYTFTVDVKGNTSAIRGMVAVVRGCMGSVMLSSGERRTECSILADESSCYDSTTQTYRVDFSTFGFSPSSAQTIEFRTMLPDGSSQTDERDITSMLSGDDRHIADPIVIDYDKPIEGSGGFNPPVVGDWQNKFEDIII